MLNGYGLSNVGLDANGGTARVFIVKRLCDLRCELVNIYVSYILEEVLAGKG